MSEYVWVESITRYSIHDSTRLARCTVPRCWVPHNPYLSIQGKQYVFIPDQPLGPHAHLYRPVHTGRGKLPRKGRDRQRSSKRSGKMPEEGGGEGESDPSALFRFRTDANM